MVKKDYITEITDAFGDEITSKQAIKLAKKIKQAQDFACPSKDFRLHLKDRLRNIHVMDECEDEAPRFSLFQIFWTLCSFIFISGSIFLVYSTAEVPRERIAEDIPTDIYTDIVSEEYDYIQIPVNEPNKANETQINAIIQKSWEHLEKQKEESFQEVERVDKESVGVWDEVIPENPESIEVFPSQLRWSSFNDQNFAPASTTQISWDSSDIITPSNIQSFIKICEENLWIVSDDTYECLLPNGWVCNRDNIWEYSIQRCEALYSSWSNSNNNSIPNDLEIDLEELIQEFGQ